MSRKQQLRGTSAYVLGYQAFEDRGPAFVVTNPYFFGDNHEAWKLGWLDAQQEYADREAREPDDRMRDLLSTIRFGDDGNNAAIAEALEMIWEKVK